MMNQKKNNVIFYNNGLNLPIINGAILLFNKIFTKYNKEMMEICKKKANYIDVRLIKTFDSNRRYPPSSL